MGNDAYDPKPFFERAKFMSKKGTRVYEEYFEKLDRYHRLILKSEGGHESNKQAAESADKEKENV